MVYYTIINESDDYNDLGFKLRTLKEAKERIRTKNTKKKSSQTKEVKTNEQEKVKRTGRPRKSA